MDALPVKLLAAGLLTAPLSGCVTSQSYAPSFASGFEVPESDGILIEWHNCTDANPCITGDLDGEPYAFGFHESPSQLVGTLAGKQLHLGLDPASVYRLGDHVIDLLFADAKHETYLTLTWNELDQRPIESRLIPPDEP